MKNNRPRKTSRRVGSRGGAVTIYLTAAALEDWCLIPLRERSARVQKMAREYAEQIEYAHDPTRQKADK